MTAGDQHREAIRRRYLRLGAGELFAAAVFAYLALATIPHTSDGDGRLALWSALTPLLVILVQAGLYWCLARSWVARRPMPAGLATLYRTFRAVDLVLLLVGIIGVITWAPDHTLLTAGIVAIWLFGVVEFANYFVVRLAYPPRRWLRTVGRWRKPRLVLDMARRR